MKLVRPARRPEQENVVPLINVVFLLLIFFMLAGKLGQSDPFDLTPPSSASDRAPADGPATVYIAPDGRTALGQEVMALDALQQAIRAHAQTGLNAVRLKADRSVEANRVIDVMDALRRGGLTRLTFLTTTEADR